MADEALTAGAVARRLGVAVTTLRTWHQRYGLGPSEHVPGHHRRYTPQDMDRLQVMRRLTAQGVAPAEAAAWARRVPVPMNGTTPIGRTPAPDTSALDQHPGVRVVSRDGGGHAIPVGRAGPAARGLARAAMRLDAPALRDILEMTLATRGVIQAWTDVIMPVLVGIGARIQETRRFVEVEHLLSRSITEALSVVPRPSGVPRVLLTAADEEQHTLPLEALAAALAEAGVPTRLLGARVPPRALGDAISRTGPAVVVVWSQLPETADPAQLSALLTGRERPFLVAAAGPGWPPDRLPDEVLLLSSLTDAVEMITVAAAA
ncbi:MAG TPA: MerR family transcriptional regulator [Actinoplanes sp.]|nr:MerR family transcriptional regulator [Actinoplanes sp.]